MTSPSGAFALSFAALRDGARTSSAPAETSTLSDAQLIALARESHAEAFELMYATYKARVHTFLLRLVADPDLADELTQEVFTKAFRALPSFTNEHRLLPWLYRVASNAGVDLIRRRRRFTWLRIGGLTGTIEEPQAADEHGGIPEREHVLKVLRTLPPENAAALLLHALEGYSYKEIAEIQGCSMTAVRSRIARARASFRAAYRP